MTREQEPKDVRPEEQGSHPVSKPNDEPSPNGTTTTDDSENPTVPRPPLPPQP